MAHIIRSKHYYRVGVPAGFPPMVCEVEDGALVRARVGEIDAPDLAWHVFCQMPIRPEGTVFQQKVWRTLLQVPFGQVVSYGQLARMAGVPQAVRAVGQAVGANPILWRIPCHRVVRSDGRMGGFSAGMSVKRLFLEHENISVSFSDEIILGFKNKRL